MVELVFKLLNKNNCFQLLYSTLCKEIKSDGEENKKWVSKQCYRNSDKNEKNRRQFIELIILKSKGRMNFQIFFLLLILLFCQKATDSELKRGREV